MFRITKIFENTLVAIYKIEGKVTDECLQVWKKELVALQKQGDLKLILDFCQVWWISAKAIEILVANLSKDIHLMNPSMEVRNTLHAVGLSSKVLE